MSLDPLDLRLLALLQDDASLSNAELAERVGLSASQCSRRRAGLEAAGYIRGYRADVDARKLGYGIEAFTRVTLSKHSDATAEDFAHFLEGLGGARRVRAEAPVAAPARAPGALRHRAQDHQGEPRVSDRRRLDQARQESIAPLIAIARTARLRDGRCAAPATTDKAQSAQGER
jgi:DNA-binding Lrp family transcriptional regulator